MRHALHAHAHTAYRFGVFRSMHDEHVANVVGGKACAVQAPLIVLVLEVDGEDILVEGAHFADGACSQSKA